MGRTKTAEGRVNFTKKLVENLVPREKRYNIFDSHTRGLGVLVHPSATKVFFHVKKVAGWPRRTTLGTFPDFSIENARAKASELNASLAKWKSADYEGPAPFERRRHLTLNAVLEDYIARRLKAKAKDPERAAKADRWQINKYIPSWKERRLGSIRREDVSNLHLEVGEKHGEVSANRLVQLLRRLYNWAEKEKLWSGTNPAKGITRFPEHSRERFLEADEAPRFFQALKHEQHGDLKDFIWLALATGARSGNLLAMKWSELDLVRATWTIPHVKTKSGATYVLPLVDEAVAVLKARRRQIDGDWVFPGAKKGAHLSSLKKPWARFRERAKVPDVTLHDLRRTVGSWAAAAGVALPAIGRLLGHASLQATQVYARLDLNGVRAAANLATQALFEAGKRPKRKMLEAPHE
jgi:integrase